MSSENSDAAFDLDMFGKPIEPLRDRRGRPSYKKTPENQQFVALRAAAGWTQDAIAADMGIDAKTLRKNFSRELQQGALMIEGQNLDVLSQRAREGNVSAIKELQGVIERGVRRAAKRKFEDDPAPAPETTAPMGKKEAARRDAAAAAAGESDWGDDLKPGLQ